MNSANLPMFPENCAVCAVFGMIFHNLLLYSRVNTQSIIRLTVPHFGACPRISAWLFS